MVKFVRFTRWNIKSGLRTPVSINPVEVSDIEECRGIDLPSCAITLKNNKVHIVMGTHDQIVSKLTSKDDSAAG